MIQYLRSRFIQLLVKPPAHSRRTSAFIVLGLITLIGGSYVAARGAVTMQGFYLLPLILAVSWLGLGWGITVALLAALIRIVGDLTTTWLNPDYYFAAADLSRVVSNRISGLVVYLVVVIVIHELIQLSRLLDQRVQERTAALSLAIAGRERVQAALFEAGARERSAVGRDLHDGLGQHLTAASMAARILTRRLGERADPLKEDARQLESMITDGINQTRTIARGLLLESIPPGELAGEIQELVLTSAEHHDIDCTFDFDGDHGALDTLQSSHLFYIAREALRNALRHARANRLSVQLRVDSAHAEIAVDDNGTGIPAGATRHAGMGLHIMAQRAEFMGGTLRILTPSGGGTRIECHVPVSAGLSRA